jgi:predicted RNA binding protein YcfA (HicA-like mRNA interferase family)
VGESLLSRLVGGGSDANIRFNDLRRALLLLGFVERVRGSHHIFTRDGVEEILNLQPRAALAKPYQVKQVRKMLIRYRLVAGAE